MALRATKADENPRNAASGCDAAVRGFRRCPPSSLVRETGARTDSRSSHRRAHRRVPCDAPARCGVVAGVRRRRRAQNTNAEKRVAGSRHPLQPVEWPPNASRFPPFDPVREAGARTDSALSHRRAHRHLPSRYAHALRRVVAGEERGLLRKCSADFCQTVWRPLTANGSRFLPCDPVGEADARPDDDRAAHAPRAGSHYQFLRYQRWVMQHGYDDEGSLAVSESRVYSSP
jgi:hypothetical protein